MTEFALASVGPGAAPHYRATVLPPEARPVRLRGPSGPRLIGPESLQLEPTSTGTSCQVSRGCLWAVAFISLGASPLPGFLGDYGDSLLGGGPVRREAGSCGLLIISIQISKL